MGNGRFTTITTITTITTVLAIPNIIRCMGGLDWLPPTKWASCFMVASGIGPKYLISSWSFFLRRHPIGWVLDFAQGLNLSCDLIYWLFIRWFCQDWECFDNACPPSLAMSKNTIAILLCHGIIYILIFRVFSSKLVHICVRHPKCFGDPGKPQLRLIKPRCRRYC